MSKELVISSNRHETRVAILEDDQLVEIYFQRANEYSLAGSIHKGRVTRVLPGMQSAFVDLGLERDTFLYVSDFFEENGEDFDSVDEKPARGERHSGGRRESPRQAMLAPPVETEEIAIEEPVEEEPAASPIEDDAEVAVAEEAISALPVQSGGSQPQQERGGRNDQNNAEPETHGD